MVECREPRVQNVLEGGMDKGMGNDEEWGMKRKTDDVDCWNWRRHCYPTIEAVVQVENVRKGCEEWLLEGHHSSVNNHVRNDECHQLYQYRLQ